MNSDIVSVADILSRAKTLISSGFSKGYNFDSEKAELYFDELLANSVSPVPIFSGILILERSRNNYTIVDGVQRLTTVCLLLCALCETYKDISKNNSSAREKILSRFLLQNNSSIEPKLKLSENEKDIYKNLLLAKDLTEEEQNSNLYQTLQAFKRKIEEQKITGTELFKIISRMQFMTVITDKSEISVADLYHTLNKNKGVSQVKLIDEFISQQDSSLETIWSKIVDIFDSEYMLESFLRDFLTTRNDEEVPNNLAVYTNFKNYYFTISKYQDAETILHTIYKYAQYYLKIINADFDNEQIREQISFLNSSDGKETYPYLMEVLDDLDNSHISIEAFINILMMINSFIKNREDVSVSNMNIDFATLSKELNKMLVLKDYVPEILSEHKLTINDINNLTTFEV